MRECLGGVLIALFYLSLSRAAHSDEALQPFTVEKAIESARVLTISGDAFPDASTPLTDQFALFSPDGTRFIARTRRGNIPLDVNIDTLLLWKRAEVEGALRSGKSLPQPVQVHAHEFHQDGGALDGLEWESPERLSFRAEGEKGIVQAFLLDTDSKRVSQLTRSTTDVVSFATSGSQTIYYAREAPPPVPTVVQASDLTLYDLYNLDAHSSHAIVLYRQARGSRKAQQLSAGAYLSTQPKIWISPGERYAITLAPEVNPPASWSRYQVRTRGYTDISVRDPRSAENAQRLRYILIDLATGTSRPLLDAPAGTLASNGTPLEVFWPRGGKSVIVSNTYLPVPDDEARSAILEPVIAEISLQTGAAIVVATESVPKPGVPATRRISRIEYNDGAGELLVTRRTGDAFSRERYRRSGSNWALSQSPDASTLPADELRVWLHQSAAERPKLHAALGDDAERELYDPSRELERYAFGRQDTFRFQFQDKERTAALIYPVGYREGQRYPLVLQTHGLGKDEFVLEGPSGSTTAYAAQAFANAGFVVAQLPDIRVNGYNTADEGPDNAQYWHTAIEVLEARGLIDREKVGVISWSRTGYHLIAALARYPDLFKAASISDAIQYGGYVQVLAMPARSDRIRSHAEMTSGRVFERGFTRWIEDRNGFYASLQSRTPLRVEGIGAPIAMWETFAARRMQGLPAEYVYYPSGSHTLMKPSERLASQGGSVDWFRFWIQGYEDPAPAKAGQYARWRAMRGVVTHSSGNQAAAPARAAELRGIPARTKSPQ